MEHGTGNSEHETRKAEDPTRDTRKTDTIHTCEDNEGSGNTAETQPE